VGEDGGEIDIGNMKDKVCTLLVSDGLLPFSHNSMILTAESLRFL